MCRRTKDEGTAAFLAGAGSGKYLRYQASMKAVVEKGIDETGPQTERYFAKDPYVEYPDHYVLFSGDLTAVKGAHDAPNSGPPRKKQKKQRERAAAALHAAKEEEEEEQERKRKENKDMDYLRPFTPAEDAILQMGGTVPVQPEPQKTVISVEDATTLAEELPRYGSRTRPSLITLLNKREPLFVLKEFFGAELVPLWLTEELQAIQTPENPMLTTVVGAHTGYYKSKDRPYIWCPVMVEDGLASEYGLYYTLVNRLDQLQQLLKLSGGQRSPVFREVAEVQDRYMLMALHMELKNCYTHTKLFEPAGPNLPSPANLYWPSPLSPFTMENIPDLFTHIFYLQYWGGRQELPWVDPQVLKLIHILEKALPSPCKSRSSDTLLPADWCTPQLWPGTAERSDTLVYDCVVRIMLGSLFGVYDHCRVRADFHARRAIYRTFCLIDPDRRRLKAWTKSQKRLVTYMFREFVFVMITGLPGLHKALCDMYNWKAYMQNTYDAMDQVRRHFNAVMEKHANCVAPVANENMEVIRPMNMLVAKGEINDIFQATWVQEVENGVLREYESMTTKFYSIPTSSVSTEDIPSFVKEEGKNTNARNLGGGLTVDGTRAVSILPWQPGYSAFEGTENMLTLANRQHLRISHRPITLGWIAKVNQVLGKLDEANYGNKRLQEAEKAFPESKRKLMEQWVLSKPNFSYRALFAPFGVRAHAAVEELHKAIMMYRHETQRTKIKKVLINILRTDPYDYVGIRLYFQLVAKRDSFVLYDFPKQILQEQICTQHVLYQTPPGEKLYQVAGLYYYCPSCGTVKTNIYDFVTKRSKKKKKKKRKGLDTHNAERLRKYSLFSVGTCVDILTGKIMCAKKASRNNPKHKAATAKTEQTTDKEEKTPESPKLATQAEIVENISDLRKKYKGDRKRKDMDACVRTELIPFNATGKYWKAPKARTAFMCPPCAGLSVYSRYHYELSNGKPNCGCLRGKFLPPTKPICCILCKKGTKKPRYKLMYDDEMAMGPESKLRRVPLCEDHAEGWMNRHDLLRVSAVRKAVAEGTWSIGLGGAGSKERIFMPKGKRARDAANMKGYVNKRRTSVLTQDIANEIEQETERYAKRGRRKGRSKANDAEMTEAITEGEAVAAEEE